MTPCYLLLIIAISGIYFKSVTCGVTKRLSCPVYTAYETKSATVGFCTCNVKLCPNDIVSIVVPQQYCNTSSNIAFFRVAGDMGKEILSGSPTSSCVLVSQWRMTLSNCGTISIQQGCLADTSCQSQLQIIVETSKFFRNHELNAQGNENSLKLVNVDSVATSSSYTSTCQYISQQMDGNRKGGPQLMIAGIVIYVLVFGIAFLCCIVRLLIYRKLRIFGRNRANYRVYTEDTPTAFPILGTDIQIQYPKAEVAISTHISDSLPLEIDIQFIDNGSKVDEEEEKCADMSAIAHPVGQANAAF